MSVTEIRNQPLQEAREIQDNRLVVSPVVTEVARESFHYRAIFEGADNPQREQFRMFLDNIFLQLNTPEFFTLIDSIFLQHPDASDHLVYQELCRRMGNGEAKLGTLATFKQILRSLRELKGDLAAQVERAMRGRQKVEGLVEIGYPGRMIRPIQGVMSVSGPIVAVNEQESITDYIQCGFPRPYNQFKTLDYQPLDLPESSADMVTIFIGLHHCPEERLDAFVDSIARTLRPGGSLILMDHNANSAAMKDLACTIHSVFNAATGVPFEGDRPGQDEKTEVRNFQSLQYWIDLLATKGLILDTTVAPQERTGDSTHNQLIRLIKKPTNADELNVALRNSNEYRRDQIKTYLTGPEWRNVRGAQALATLAENQSPYNFPFFKELRSFWRTFGNSWSAARNSGASFLDVATSDHTSMILFIGVTQTIEYFAKGLTYSLLHWIRPDVAKKTNTEKAIIAISKDYGQFIETTPFYKYPYISKIGAVWKAFWEDLTAKRTENRGHSFRLCITNFISALSFTIESVAKSIISAPVNWIFSSSAFLETDTLQMLVHNREDLDLEETVDAINQKLDHEQAIGVRALRGPRVEIVQDHGFATHLKVPRYGKFKTVLIELAKAGVDISSICGQKKIQVDLKVQNEQIIDIQGSRILYSLPAADDQDKQMIALEVEIAHLKDVFIALSTQGVTIDLVHDF